MRKPSTIAVLLYAALPLAATGVAATSAWATFPGRNGPNAIPTV